MSALSVVPAVRPALPVPVEGHPFEPLFFITDRGPRLVCAWGCGLSIPEHVGCRA